ncbi:MAG: hypothetical protein AAF679_03555 [Pseudomonadota bacterium]
MRGIFAPLICVALVGCGIDRTDPEVQRALPPEATGLDAPRLVPVEVFAPNTAAPASVFEATEADLQDRLSALRARADALNAPVLSARDKRLLAR